MIEEKDLIFPDLIFFNDYAGDFKSYFKAVYAVFETDFIKTKPKYEGLKVTVRKYPEVDGIHRTFYHITHQGEDENNRQPDIRRMERIRYPRFVMVNHTHNQILIWKNKKIAEDIFLNSPQYLPENSLLVYNNTRVIQARMLFQKKTGARIEIFCLEPAHPSDYALSFSANERCAWKCMVGNIGDACSILSDFIAIQQ